MKKIVLIYLVFINNVIFGQYNSGKVIYQYKFNDATVKQKPQNKVAQKIINDLYKDLINYSGKISYELIFNQHLSKYKIIESLTSDSDKSIEMIKNSTGGNEVIYTDSEKNYKLKLLDFFGDRVMVKDTLACKWNLTQEKKKINNYLCYKAWMKNENNILIEAWYTPQIPINLGPKGYNNLPGLILELKQVSLLFVAKEIVLNPKEKITITIPENRKIITQKEFDKMLTSFDRERKN